MTSGEYLSMGCGPNGKRLLRVQFLALIAKVLRIQFKIGGLPNGASYERAINHRPLREDRVTGSCSNVRGGPIAG